MKDTNKLTDSELYELLCQGIEPEGVEKVTDEEVNEWLDTLEVVLNDKQQRCPCQNKEEVNKRIQKGVDN